MQKSNLHEVFIRIKNNEEGAIEELYRESKELIYSIAYSLVKNRENSEDIVQNVYLKIVKMDKNLLPTSFEKSWIYTVTKNETINYIKKTNKEINAEDIYEISIEDEELKRIIDKDTYNKIINRLSEKDKNIVSLKILGDMKFREISEILNMPIGTVQWRYYKSLNTMKLLIGNIAMFVLTFSIFLGKVMKREKVSNDAAQSAGQEIVKDEEVTDAVTDDEVKKETLENNDKAEMLENERIEGTIIDVTTQTASNGINTDIVTVGVASASGIFLIISIILTLIIIKNKYRK